MRILQTKSLASFTCLGDRCSDTCCKGWAMQMDEVTLARYRAQAPELLDSVEQGQEAPWVMRRNTTGHCVRLESGWCGIHKSHGASFLGDACYFYPRVTRALGETVAMTATMSCPEIARLALFEENDPVAFETVEADRLPQSLKNYLPQDMSVEDALAVHKIFLDAALDESIASERAFLRIHHVSHFLEGVKKIDWPRAIPFYIANADAQLPQPEKNPADPFNVLHMLCGLIVATKKPMSERLQQTVQDMEKALDVHLDWQNVKIETRASSEEAYQKIKKRWHAIAKNYDKILRRWLAMQLSIALYPFGGFGNTIAERATLIGMRMATLRLAFMCKSDIKGETEQESVIRIVQSLSRLLDHLADPSFSLQICRETGWDKASRMRGVLET